MFYEDEVIPQIQRNLGESATQWVSAALDEAKRNGRTFKHMEGRLLLLLSFYLTYEQSG